VLLEFARLLGLSGDRPLALGPAKEGVILMISGVILAFVGYKIKGIAGAVVSLLLGAAGFLYLKGYF
jgi:hypothetical protein